MFLSNKKSIKVLNQCFLSCPQSDKNLLESLIRIFPRNSNYSYCWTLERIESKNAEFVVAITPLYFLLL